MQFLLHLNLGFLMAFVGLMPPGMLNMTTVKTTLHNGRSAGAKFAAGAALVVFVQASIALIFTHYFDSNPEVVQGLKVIGGLVFIALAAMFFLQGRKRFNTKAQPKKSKHFLTGITMSSANMLSIPFYLVWSAILNQQGYLELSQPFITVFVIGASLGAFTLFIVYSYFAQVIEQKAAFIAQNINFILSGLFLILGLVTFYNLWM